MADPEKLRLLVIDDDDALRDLFRMNMEAAGFKVDEAADGFQGVAMARELKPHLIVLDLMMPKLSGTEVLHRLQDAGLDAIPVVVITAYGRKFSEELLRREPNVVEFLEKPIRYGELALKLRRYAESAQGKP